MNLFWFCLALGIAALFVGAVLPGCDLEPASTYTGAVRSNLDAECRQAVHDYNLLDQIAEAQWRARDHKSADATYEQICDLIDAHRRCFH